MKNTISILIIYVLSSALVPTMAQEATHATMSLHDCLKTALESNLTLRSGKIAIERAKDLQATAFDFNKTDISLSQTPTTGGGPENALTFSQALEFPTVYGARRSKLKAETQLEEARYAVDRNTLERDVATAYNALRYAIEQQRLYTVQDTIYTRFLAIAKARHGTGESSALEHIAARRLFDENRVAMANAIQAVNKAQLRLALLLNTDQLIVPSEPTFTAMEDNTEGNTPFTPQNVPSVTLASQANIVAEKNLKLARQAFMPDISVGASTQLLIKGFNPYNVDRSRFTEGNFMGFDVGISVPLFYGAKRARLKAAKKEVEQSRLLAEQEMKAASANFRLAQSEFTQAQQRLSYYEDNGNEAATETYRLSQIAYEKGDIAYVEYIQNLQAALAIQTAYAEAVNGYNQALINLKYIQSNHQ